jgi:predicted PurR-regulated permease PerM
LLERHGVARRLRRVACVTLTPQDQPSDAAHVRAREVSARYAPAEPRALGTMAALATLAIMWVVLPVGLGVLVGALLALTLDRPYTSLAHRSGRPALVAFATTAVTTVVVGGIASVLGYLLVQQGIVVVAELPASLRPGGAAASVVERAARPLAALGQSPASIAAHLNDALGTIASTLAGWAARAVGVLVDWLLALLFMAATMYFVLRHWNDIARRAERLMPLNPHHTRRLMREIRRLGRTVVVGNFGTAVVQGVVAGVGYAIARVPQPAFFAAVTAVVSLVPVFGTVLVWLPAALVLMLTDRVGAGVFVLVWGSLAVVGFCDYVVRPRLVGRGETTSTWLTLVAIFGGIKLFGAVGLLLGPLLTGLAASVLRLYERTRRFRLGLR